MFVVIAMGAGMHHVQYVMEIEGEMDICQMEKSAICAREKQGFGVLHVMVPEKLKIRKIRLQNEGEKAGYLEGYLAFSKIMVFIIQDIVGFKLI